MASPLEYVATALFAIAIVHTFSVPVFARLANHRAKIADVPWVGASRNA